MTLDLTLFRFLNSIVGYSKATDVLAIFFASVFPYVVAVFAALLLMRERNWKTRFYNLAVAALTLLLSRGIMVTAIRFFYNRPRPFAALPEVSALIEKSALEPSFPSGHATAFFAIAALCYYIDRKWFRYFFIAAIVIGIARVVVGVHYPLDILAGAIVGWGSAWAIRRIMKKEPALTKLNRSVTM